MESHEVSILRGEHRLEVEMPKASEEINGHMPLHLSCNSICSFSNQKYDILDSEQRSKSAVKLCGLIVFYIIFMALEIVGGMKANSLAVLTDAAHLLTDIAGISISLFTVWASGWEATSRNSFGFNRLEVLGALVSIQLIWLISGVLIYEAIDRILQKNAKVNGKLMFVIAAFGFLINSIMVIWIGHGHSHHGCTHNDHDHDHDHEREGLCATTEEDSTNLVSTTPEKANTLNINLQGAYLHVIADLIQSVGVMIAGCIIWAKPDWLVVDLVCTLIFSVLAICTTMPMLKNIFYILMEGTPSDFDIGSLENGIKCIGGVLDVHDLHVWAITVGKIVLACHVIVEPGINSSEVVCKIRNYCEKTHRICHVTIQIEQR